jgi:ribosome-associated protein
MTDNENLKTDSESIKLDQFLKIKGVVDTGGQAKLLIQDGEVKVNGKVETRRGRKLIQGDRISTLGDTFKVDLSNLLDGWD